MTEQPDNLRIWNVLGKTDPKHTKPFNRSGGFKGTAVKPIYQTRKMTELFGPCGVGWGMTKPDFQVVPGADNETLVYCTVGLWHGEPGNLVYGVGGDKVVGKNKHGLFSDDEAFKKSYTDALSNAMKQIGAAADIHMGQHDDDKYVTALRGEFAGGTATDSKPAPEHGAARGPLTITDLKKKMGEFAADLPECRETETLEGCLRGYKAVLEQCERDLPSWWFGNPKQPDVAGFKDRIEAQRQIAERSAA